MGLKELRDEEILSRMISIKMNDRSFEAVEKQYCEELYSRYYKQAYNICRYYGLSFNDAEDVSQESFIKLFNNIHSFDTTKLFKPWFFKLVFNKVRDKYKELKRHNSKDIDTLNESSTEKDENIFERFQIREYLNSIISKIPEKLKSVLVLKVYGDMDFEMIGKTLGISSRQARNRLDQAQELLKKVAEAEHDHR